MNAFFIKYLGSRKWGILTLYFKVSLSNQLKTMHFIQTDTENKSGSMQINSVAFEITKYTKAAFHFPLKP